MPLLQENLRAFPPIRECFPAEWPIQKLREPADKRPSNGPAEVGELSLAALPPEGDCGAATWRIFTDHMERARQAEAEIDVTNSCCGIDTHAATAVSPLSIHSRAWNSNRCICGKNTALDARAVFISARTPLATVRYWVRANASGRIAMHIQNRLLRADFI